MTSSVSGQDKPNPALWLATRTGKKERYCPLACFVSAIKFRRCPSGCMKLPFRKIFSVSVKIISVIFLLGWNTVVDEFQEHILQQNRQTQKWKHEATWRRGMSNNRSFIDQASSVKIAGCWPRFMDLDLVSFNDNAKRELAIAQYSSILTSRPVNDINIIIIMMMYIYLLK